MLKKLLLTVAALLSMSFTPLANSYSETQAKSLGEKQQEYYLVGTFNDYQINDQYRLNHNVENSEYYEYTITLDLKKNDLFYVSDKNNTIEFKSPDNNEFNIEKDGSYKINFSKEHDYGNNYHVNYHYLSEADEEEIISIKTNEEFINMINRSYSDNYTLNKIFNIENDINLGGVTINPISIFSGTLNGNNHRIYNFNLNNYYSGNETGFIRKLTNTGVIDGLILEYDLTINNEATSVGGLVGVNDGEIRNCTYNGIIKGINNVGGIVGLNNKDGLIKGCLNNASIKGRENAGGITGYNKGEVLDSINKGNINETRFSSRDELSVSSIGGIVGYNEGNISSVNNYGLVGFKQLGKHIGGVAGYSLGRIYNAQNDGLINGKSNVGGIAGTNMTATILNINDSLLDISKPSISMVINRGTIFGESSIGGIVGYVNNINTNLPKFKLHEIALTYNEGTIEGLNNDVGGIIGLLNKGDLLDSFNTGLISSKSAENVGGIVGNSSGDISYCYALCDIDGSKYVGGIAGKANKLTDTYSIVNISSSGPFTGALIGTTSNLDNINNNYYVFNNVNGIDNTDYLNKANRVSKFDLASQGMLSIDLNADHFIAGKSDKRFPMMRKIVESEENNSYVNYIKDKIDVFSKFGSIITFIANDKIIKRVFVEYNKDLDKALIPNVPNKEGYFGKWENFNCEKVTTNIYVDAVYDEIITSISNDRNEQNNVIVEGKFYNTTKVTLSYKNNDVIEDNYKYKGTYTVNINDPLNTLDLNNVKIKLRLPNKTKNPVIGYMNNGKLEIIESYLDGEYICFNFENNKDFYLLEKNVFNWTSPMMIVIYVISTCLVTLLTVGLIIKFKKNKKVK